MKNIDVLYFLLKISKKQISQLYTGHTVKRFYNREQVLQILFARRRTLAKDVSTDEEIEDLVLRAELEKLHTN